MQSLLDHPREPFTIQQVMDVLVYSKEVSVSIGMDLLDTKDSFVEDLTPYLLYGSDSITRDNFATVHSSLAFSIQESMQWGVDRVKPYMMLSSPTVSNIRFDLGVYVLMTPIQDLSPVLFGNTVYKTTGYDKLYLLNQPIGDTYTVPAGSSYLNAVQTMIVAAGAGNRWIFDQSALSKVTPVDVVFPLDSNTQNTTWLTAINALLAGINYRGLWADQEGRYRSEPYQNPSVRGVEFDISVLGNSNSVTSDENRTVSDDQWNIPNKWVFVQNNTVGSPVEGVSMYTVNNTAVGRSSQTSLGRVVPVVYFYDAADYATLVSLGNNRVSADMDTPELFTISTFALPIAGHFDILRYSDPNLSGRFGNTRKLQARSWQLPLDGSNMTWALETVGP